MFRLGSGDKLSGIVELIEFEVDMATFEELIDVNLLFVPITQLVTPLAEDAVVNVLLNRAGAIADVVDDVPGIGAGDSADDPGIPDTDRIGTADANDDVPDNGPGGTDPFTKVGGVADAPDNKGGGSERR